MRARIAAILLLCLAGCSSQGTLAAVDWAPTYCESQWECLKCGWVGLPSHPAHACAACRAPLSCGEGTAQ